MQTGERPRQQRSSASRDRRHAHSPGESPPHADEHESIFVTLGVSADIFRRLASTSRRNRQDSLAAQLEQQAAWTEQLVARLRSTQGAAQRSDGSKGPLARHPEASRPSDGSTSPLVAQSAQLRAMGSTLSVTDSPLTAREREVAALVGRGLSNHEIAGDLWLSDGTVANHVARILGKLGFRTRVQIAVWVTASGGGSGASSLPLPELDGRSAR